MREAEGDCPEAALFPRDAETGQVELGPLIAAPRGLLLKPELGGQGWHFPSPASGAAADLGGAQGMHGGARAAASWTLWDCGQTHLSTDS